MPEAYTYAPPVGGVFPTVKDRVRYLVGDRRPAAPFSLSDSEIEFELLEASNDPNEAAARVAHAMADSYSSESATSKSVGSLSISRGYSDTARRFYLKARALRGSGGAVAGIFTGGAAGEPQFFVGQFDNNSE